MQNEEFDTQFITVVVKYNGGETSEFPYDVNTMTVTGFDSSELCEKQTITLTYNGFETTFDISIIKAVAPLTTTTTKIGANYTRFYVDFEEDMSDATIIISVVEENGKLEKVITAECDGDSRYTLTIPSLTKSKLAKVFVWSGLDTIKPLGVPEFIEIK